MDLLVGEIIDPYHRLFGIKPIVPELLLDDFGLERDLDSGQISCPAGRHRGADRRTLMRYSRYEHGFRRTRKSRENKHSSNQVDHKWFCIESPKHGFH